MFCIEMIALRRAARKLFVSKNAEAPNKKKAIQNRMALVDAIQKFTDYFDVFFLFL